jgi:nucleoside-diphosphate-sugar epimerase
VDDHAASMTEMVTTLADEAGASRPIAVPSWLPKLIAPYLAGITSMRLGLSNAKARAELGWHPAYPTYREGLREVLHHAA